MKIGIVYGHVASNLGDLAVNRGTASLLRQVFPDCVLQVVFHNPTERYLEAAKSSFQQSCQAHFAIFCTPAGDYDQGALDEATELFRYAAEPEQFLASTGLLDCNLIVYNSGEHLFSRPRGQNRADLLWRVLPGLAAAAAHIPFVVLPSTYGPFDHTPTAALLRGFLASSQGFAARENFSARLLAQDLGMSKPPVLLDPAFFVGQRTKPQPRERPSLGIALRLERFGLRCGQTLSSRTSAEMRAGSFRNSRSFQLAKALAHEFASRGSGDIHLFVQTLADRDLAIAIHDSLADEIGEERIRLCQPASIGDYLSTLECVDFVIASRFHACVFALLLGRPVAGLSFNEHGHKIPGLFEMLSCKAHYRNFSNERIDTVVQVLPRLLGKGHDDFKPIPRRIHHLQEQTRHWLAQAATRQPQGDLASPLRSFLRLVEALRTERLQVLQSRQSYREAQEKSELRSSLVAATKALESANPEKQRIVPEMEASRKGKSRQQAEIEALKSELLLAERRLLALKNAATVLLDRDRTLKKQLASLRSELSHKEAARDQLETELRAEKDRQTERLAGELRAAERKVASTAYECLRLRADTFELQSHLRAIQKSKAHRIATAITQTIRSWRSFVSHPLRTFRILRNQRGLLLDYDFQLLLTKVERDLAYLLKHEGAIGVQRALQLFSFSPRTKAALLGNLAKHVQTHDLDLSIDLGRRAYDLDPRPFRAKWLAFRYFDNGNVRPAAELLEHVGEDTSFAASEEIARSQIFKAWALLRRTQGMESPSSTTAINENPAVIPLPANRNSLSSELRAELKRRFEKAFEIGGPRAAEELALAQSEGHTSAFRAFCFLRAADCCRLNGELEAAAKLAEAAVEIDASQASLHALARERFHCLDLDGAESALNILEQIASPVPVSTAELAEEIRNYHFLVREASSRPPDKTPGFEAIPNRSVCFLHSSLPYLTGGYAARAHGILRAVRLAGIDVRPYTRPGFPADTKATLKEADVAPADSVDGILYRRLLGGVSRRSGEHRYMRACIGRFEDVLREERPSVVHGRSTYLISLPALIAARRLGLPFVYEVSGLWELVQESRDQARLKRVQTHRMRYLEGVVCREADHVYTLTEAMRDELIARGVDPERITIVPNCVDSDRFKPIPPHKDLAKRLNIPLEVPVIGYVGSFQDYEGLDDLVRACALLRAEGHDFRLLLVGDGAAAKSLGELISETGLGDRTVLTGRVPYEEVGSYYSLIDICPFPRKPWRVCEIVSPVKPFEALAMEKAVVVSSVRALAEIVEPSHTGMVFCKGDVSSLVEVLRKLILEPRLRSELATQGRDWVQKNRTWQGAGQVVLDGYRSATTQGRGGTGP